MYLFIYASVSLCLYVCISIYRSFYLSFYLYCSNYCSIYLSICLPVYLSTYLLNPPSFDLSIDRSIYASATSRMRYGILTRDLTGKVLAFENGLSRFVFRKSVEHGTRIVFGV